MSQPFGVWIEAHQLQQFIFETPKLRIMVGANALLGELWYHHLPQMLNKGGRDGGTKDGSWQPLALSHDYLNATNPFADPLSEDNPYYGFPKGIVNHAGGHFQALFTSEPCARAFAKAAWKEIKIRVPGLPVDVFVFPVDLNSFSGTEQNRRKIQRKKREHPSSWISHAIPPTTWFPWGRPCDWSELEQALVPGKGEKTPPGGRRIGSRTRLKWERGKAFDRQNLSESTKDPLRLLEDDIYAGEKLSWIFSGDKAPAEFTELIRPKKELSNLPMGNLALVKIDGNRYGACFKKILAGLQAKDYATGAAEVERFWHWARCLMRMSLKQAMQSVLQLHDLSKYFEHFPFRVLMLGGDDLLLVCSAELAFDFLIAFEKAFRTLQAPESFKHLLEQKEESPFPLTFSAGMIVIPANFPFYAANELAESLLGSAKKASRQQPGNWVDWHVLTTGHTDTIDHIRRRQYVRYFEDTQNPEWLVLTRRPYPIAQGGSEIAGQPLDSSGGNQATPSITLAQLWQIQVVRDQWDNKKDNKKTGKDESRAARRKLKQMRLSLYQGRQVAQQDFEAFFSEGLEKNFGFPKEQIWQQLQPGQSSPNGATFYGTWMTDLLEMCDIATDWQRRMAAHSRKEGDA